MGDSNEFNDSGAIDKIFNKTKNVRVDKHNSKRNGLIYDRINNLNMPNIADTINIY